MIPEEYMELNNFISWWFIHLSATSVITLVVLLIYRNQVNNGSKNAKKTRIFLCLYMCLLSCLYVTGLLTNLHEKTIGLSMLLVFLYSCYMLLFINVKQINRMYIIFFLKMVVCIFSINLLLLSFYNEAPTIFVFYSLETYHFVVFCNQSSVSCIILSFFYSTIYFSKQQREIVLLEMTSIRILSESEENCPICLDTLQSDIDVISTKCKHKFHKKCLAVSLERSDNCPICRRSINHPSLCF